LKSRTSRLIALLTGLTCLTAIAMVCLQLWLMNGLSTGANKIDDAKSRHSIEAMLSELLTSKAGLVLDNAKWDDAVDHTYGTLNADWFQEMWATSTFDGNYDAVAIIDLDRKLLAGRSGTSELTIAPDLFFGSGLKDLIDALPADGKTFATSSGILRTQKGLAAVGAAPILPHTAGKVIPEGPPRILIFSQTLTPQYIADLGQLTVLDGLELTQDAAGSKAAFPVKAINGETIGYLRWNADLPGDEARAAIELPAIAATLALIASMLAATLVSARLSLRLQERDRQSRELANTDTLTGLPNRHATLTTLADRTGRTTTTAYSSLAVMLVDLDGFKEVNDIYGHHVGDRLLKCVSAGFGVLAGTFDAKLCRLGGDEFAIILFGPNSCTDARTLSGALLKLLQEPIDIDGRITRVGASIGIATSSGGEDATELLRRADVAMYSAKAMGKNRWVPYEPALDAERNSRAELAEQMKTALSHGNIHVAFQPIVDAVSHRIVGAEALARWTLPNGERVSPDQFIGITEEFGLIDELGNQVLEIACIEALAWPGISLSVNVSPAQFRNPNFVRNLIAIVDATGLPRGRLELEITEGYMIENRERTKPIIDYLIAEGFKITLDDFGSGYSSIGYLRAFPFGKVKIDKSLADGMMHSQSSRSIIAAAASIARSMEMSVTGEGVECKEQAEMLRLLGCDTLQGYFFSHPLPAAAFTALLNTQFGSAAAA
jgi:diguanylate cyclase (GGDEF)-like protein